MKLKLASIYVLLTYSIVSCEFHDPEKDGNLVPLTVTQDLTLPRFETSDGVLLHLTTFGDPSNPVLVVLHGGPGAMDYHAYDNLISLSDQYFLVLFDQRGAGLSQRVDEPDVTGITYMQDINDLKAQYSPGQKINLLGHSFGGLYATLYTYNYPENVNKLILAEPMAMTKEANEGWDNGDDPGILSNELNQVLEAFEYTLPNSHAEADYMWAMLQLEFGADDQLFGNEDFSMTNPSRFGYFAAIGILNWLGFLDESYKNMNFLDDFRNKFQNEVLIMAADHSSLGYDFQEEFHQPFFENVEMVKISDSGHYFFIFKPTVAVPIVRNFLNE